MFHSGDTLLRDEFKPERSSDFDQNTLKELVECNLRKSTREFALDFNNPNPKSTAT